MVNFQTGKYLQGLADDITRQEELAYQRAREAKADERAQWEFEQRKNTLNREEAQRDLVNQNIANVARGAYADIMAKDPTALADVAKTSGDVFNKAAKELGYTTSEDAAANREKILASVVPGTEGQTVQQALMDKYQQTKYIPTKEEMFGNIRDRLMGLGVDASKAQDEATKFASTFKTRDELKKEQQAILDARTESAKALRDDLQKQAKFALDVAKAEGKGGSSKSYKPEFDFIEPVRSKIDEGAWSNIFSSQLNDDQINAALLNQRNDLAKTYGMKTADSIVHTALANLAADNIGIGGSNVRLSDINATINAVKGDFTPNLSGSRQVDTSNAQALMRLANNIDTSSKSVGSLEDARRKSFMQSNRAILGQYGSDAQSTGTSVQSSGSTAEDTVQGGGRQIPAPTTPTGGNGGHGGTVPIARTYLDPKITEDNTLAANTMDEESIGVFNEIAEVKSTTPPSSSKVKQIQQQINDLLEARKTAPTEEAKSNIDMAVKSLRYGMDNIMEPSGISNAPKARSIGLETPYFSTKGFAEFGRDRAKSLREGTDYVSFLKELLNTENKNYGISEFPEPAANKDAKVIENPTTIDVLDKPEKQGVIDGLVDWLEFNIRPEDNPNIGRLENLYPTGIYRPTIEKTAAQSQAEGMYEFMTRPGTDIGRYVASNINNPKVDKQALAAALYSVGTPEAKELFNSYFSGKFGNKSQTVSNAERYQELYQAAIKGGLSPQEAAITASKGLLTPE